MALHKIQEVDSPFVDDVVPMSPGSESHNVAISDGEVQGPYKGRSAHGGPSVRTRDSNPDGGAAVGTPGLFPDAPLKRAG